MAGILPWLYRAQAKMLAMLAWDKFMKSKLKQDVAVIHSDGSPTGKLLHGWLPETKVQELRQAVFAAQQI